MRCQLRAGAARRAVNRDLSDAQRAAFRERFMRQRAERTAALGRIERHLLRLKGERAVRGGYEELIRRLKAVKKLAEAGDEQEAR
jgi:hypothetical protein